ncbi:MAG: protein phosphatase CheZ [Candidatus Nitricoxidivorans perseverans]|uniref:Protein phosphatase CheZ n=1 Tax=Candidatus Nitricoxidivorans perseverans TaxID=2975601 RepID=A0AA49FMS7_9PROT|nr:MAG: protein phosphatase CheZ [Candidatus Nitricoxidivorans perseverans]
MANPVSFDESGDSEDLQALFDSIAAGSVPEPSPADSDPSGDSEDLQALFDTVAAQVAAVDEAAPAEGEGSAAAGPQEAVFNRLGHMTRQLHDSLRELGYDKALEDATRRIPDARQRLSYIVQMTEQAASRVLNATDIAKPIQDDLLARSEALGRRWEKMFANQLSMDEFKSLAADSRAFFLESPAKLQSASKQLTEIMMAQDFQDLTGQVIKKVTEMVQGLEGQLLQVLIEAMPAERRTEAPSGLMNGPVISTEGRADVVTTQEQVDDLLESLGF